MFSDFQYKLFEILKEEGLYLPSGNFNASFPKKFRNSITPERQGWFDSLPGDTLSQKTFHLEHGVETLPTCKHCGEIVTFISPREGYRDYCSGSCRARGEASKVTLTNLKRYGVKAPAQNKEVQKKMQATTQQRYGVNNIFERTDLIQSSVMEKYGVRNVMMLAGVQEETRKRNLEKYGTAHTLSVPEFIQKRRETNLMRYGVVTPVQRPMVRNQILENTKRKMWEKIGSHPRFTSKATPLFTFEEYLGVVDKNTQVISYPWKCVVCQKPFEDYFASSRGPRCPHCYPPGIQGTMEKELVGWLQQEFPTMELVLNSRRIIQPLEVDIYLPQHKLAIEFDEVYWHCENQSKGKRDHHYHLGKTLACQEAGIRLLHIFDTEWFSTPEVVKSMIRAKMNVYSQRIGARQGVVRKVSVPEARQFLDNNHIQGFAPSSIRYGLYVKEELVSLLCLGKSRFLRGTYEVIRFVSKINTQVMGSLSKIWKEAEKELPVGYSLVSYVDRRFFTGESNHQLGLSYSHTNPPGFFYTKDFKVLHNRMAFQKGVLARKLENFDGNLTEWENMQRAGFDRIWDCGMLVFQKS